jgi:hypothetical protein
VLIASAKSGIRTLDDLRALALKQPGQRTFASAGIGTVHHLGFEQLNQLLGVSMVHVPFKGGPPGAAEVAAGNVDAMFVSPAAAVLGQSMTLLLPPDSGGEAFVQDTLALAARNGWCEQEGNRQHAEGAEETNHLVGAAPAVGGHQMLGDRWPQRAAEVVATRTDRDRDTAPA